MRLFHLSWLLLLPALGFTAEQRAPPPSGAAGVPEKEIQQQYKPKEVSPKKEAPLLEVDIPKTALAIPEGQAVLIEKITFQGNRAIPSEQLEKIAAPYLHRELKGSDVRELCTKIQAAYAKEGYFLALAYPPAQDIRNHTLVIVVMEGVLGNIVICGNEHYETSYIEKYLHPFLGKPINYNKLLKALFLLNETPDLTSAAIFRKGSQPGEVELVLTVKDKKPLHVYADYNNYGSVIATQQRTVGRLDWGNLLTQGSTFTFVEVIGYPPDHLSYSNALYSTPLNAKGTKLDLSYLYSRFKVGILGAEDLSGLTQIAGFKLKQAEDRTRKLNTDLVLGFDYKQFQNFSHGATTSFDKLRVLAVGGRVDFIDSFKGRNIIDETISAGIPRFLGGLKPVDDLCSRKGAGGRFFLLNLTYQRLQALPWDSLLLLNISGQITPNKLPVPQQFYLGGVDTVRGFPLATVLGDQGYFANLEVRIPPPFLADKKGPQLKKKWKELLQLLGFVDHGGVFIHGSEESQSSPVYLTSVGVGLRAYGPYGININLDIGFPLSSQHRSSDSIVYLKVTLRPW